MEIRYEWLLITCFCPKKYFNDKLKCGKVFPLFGIHPPQVQFSIRVPSSAWHPWLPASATAGASDLTATALNGRVKNESNSVSPKSPSGPVEPSCGCWVYIDGPTSASGNAHSGLVCRELDLQRSMPLKMSYILYIYNQPLKHSSFPFMFIFLYFSLFFWQL